MLIFVMKCWNGVIFIIVGSDSVEAVVLETNLFSHMAALSLMVDIG